MWLMLLRSVPQLTALFPCKFKNWRIHMVSLGYSPVKIMIREAPVAGLGCSGEVRLADGTFCLLVDG